MKNTLIIAPIKTEFMTQITVDFYQNFLHPLNAIYCRMVQALIMAAAQDQPSR